MPSDPAEDRILDRDYKARCYGCFRPHEDCFCASIPVIQNQTEVLILQHMRERFHPFNTARIVRKALTRSSLLVAPTHEIAARLCLKPRAGLLYPGAEATLLSEIPVDQRPEQLVILDGTWHHAKTFVRDIPALARLPRYRLDPTSPSTYRIRREPTAQALSTVEATVAALRVLEPDTRGLDELLNAFVAMIDHQLAHPRSKFGWRKNHRRRRGSSNIPLALLGELQDVVIAYGESTPGNLGNDDAPRPIYWVAERLGSGERFRRLIQPGFTLGELLLGHLEMSRADFDQAVSIEEARSAWAAFIRPTDTLAVYNQGVVRLLAQLSPVPPTCLVLKSVDLHPQQSYGTLDELLTAEGIVPAPPQHPGRAGKRLANLAALVIHLNALGKRQLQDHGDAGGPTASGEVQAISN